MAEQMTLVIWETAVSTKKGNAELFARKPVYEMTVKQAAIILKCKEDTVLKLFRVKILTGYKPGAIKERRDGRANNAKIKLDAESVLKYKEAITSRGVF